MSYTVIDPVEEHYVYIEDKYTYKKTGSNDLKFFCSNVIVRVSDFASPKLNVLKFSVYIKVGVMISWPRYIHANVSAKSSHPS